MKAGKCRPSGAGRNGDRQLCFFFSSRRRHTRCSRDWSSDVCSSDLCVLPTISPPSSRIRVTTVASNSGMYPSSVEAPFIIGTPATMTLSLMATRLPFSLPLGAPLMDVLRYHAFCRFSSGPGRYPGVRGYFTTGTSSGIASTALYAATYPVKSCRKASRSVSFSDRPHRVATFRTCSDVGTWTAMAPSLDCCRYRMTLAALASSAARGRGVQAVSGKPRSVKGHPAAGSIGPSCLACARLDTAGGNILREAMRVLEARRWLVRRQVIDIVCSPEADARGNPVQPRIPAHAVGDDVIGARAVAAEAQAANHFTARVKRHPTAEGDDAPGHPANAGPLL